MGQHPKYAGENTCNICSIIIVDLVIQQVTFIGEGAVDQVIFFIFLLRKHLKCTSRETVGSNFWQQHDSCASKGCLTNACTDFTNALYTLLIEERALLIGGVFCPVIYGGNGMPFFAQPVFEYLVSGTYNGIRVPVRNSRTSYIIPS